MKYLTLIIYFIFIKDVIAETLDLKKCIELGIKNNFDIKISAFEPIQKQASQTTAKSDFDLNISASIKRDRDKTPTTSSLDGLGASSALISDSTIYTTSLSKKFQIGTELDIPYSYTAKESNSSSAIFDTSHSPSLSIKLKQPLIKGFSPEYFKKDLKEAVKNWEIAKARHGEKIVKTLAKIIKTYWETVESKNEIAVKKSSYEVSKQNYNFIKQKRRIGKSSSLELIEAESAMQKNLESLLKSQLNFQNKKQELAFQVFGKSDKEIDISPHLKNPKKFNSSISLEKLINNAQKKRLEAKRGKEEIIKAQTAHKSAKLDLYPNLDLTYELSYSGLAAKAGTAHEQILETKFRSWSLALEASHPLNRYASKGALKAKQLKLEQEIIKHKQNNNNISLEVKKNYWSILSNWKRISALQKAVNAEREKFRGQERRFKLGKISTYELNKSLSDKNNALIQLIRAQISFEKSKYKLYESSGNLMEHLNLEARI